jgi:hypothetical protein
MEDINWRNLMQNYTDFFSLGRILLFVSWKDEKINNTKSGLKKRQRRVREK